MPVKERDTSPEALDPELVLRTPAPLDLPRSVDTDVLGHYMASIRSRASRETFLSVLGTAARIMARIDGDPDAEAMTVERYAWGTRGGVTFAKCNIVVGVLVAAKRVSSARVCRAALRGMARTAFNLKLLDGDERRRIDDIAAPKPSDARRGRRIREEEIERLFNACALDASPTGRRDAAILAVLLGCGLRRFEASALDLADFERPERLGIDAVRITIRHGKGDQHAVAIGAPDVAVAIEAWLALRGREPGALFYASQGRGQPLMPGHRLGPGGVYYVLKKRAAEAEIASTAPHDCRRTMITKLLQQYGDLSLAQRAARHASPATTAIYDKRGEDALASAMAAASTGYRRQ